MVRTWPKDRQFYMPPLYHGVTRRRANNGLAKMRNKIFMPYLTIQKFP
jgi:hypothetical protein